MAKTLLKEFFLGEHNKRSLFSWLLRAAAVQTEVHLLCGDAADFRDSNGQGFLHIQHFGDLIHIKLGLKKGSEQGGPRQTVCVR
jgi:hypothetical protein